MDMRTTQLGTTFSYPPLRDQCAAIWGAVAWPGKKAGFAVVAAMHHKEHLGNHDIHLLDEFESFNVEELVRQCRVLDRKYGICLYAWRHEDALDRWVGDWKHDAASKFIQQINRGQDDSRYFRLNSTAILEMEYPYHYLLPQIKSLLNPERVQLNLKEGLSLMYLYDISGNEDEIAELKFGAYPAIEALGFLVVEMRKCMSAADQRARALDRGDDCNPYRNHPLEFGRRTG